MHEFDEQKCRQNGPDGAVAGAQRLLAALRAIVGAEHVSAGHELPRRYRCSTASRATAPLAVACPATQAEVVALVRLGAQFGVPLYPLSSGRNWGYGDACAVGEAQLIVDLGRMNRIVEVDAELGYALIEPGVTQQQLSDYLQAQQLDWWIDCTGAGPHTSFMGNILERGFGHSPYGNRLQHVSGMRVVLASGEVLDTGFGHYPRARASHLFPYGVGPFIDGMFTQSNFGIVTRIGIWLLPAAACVNHFLCTVSEHEEIGALVDALRPLRMNGTLRSIVHIGNDLRVISGGRVFPRALVPDQSCLPQAVRAALRDAAATGAWTASGALYGSGAQVAAARAALKAALRGTRTRTTFLSERTLRRGGWLARVLACSRTGQRLGAQVRLGAALFAMNRGQPNGRFLAGAYWRRRAALPDGFPHGADPAQDNCGMLWISPVLPMRGADVLELHRMVEPLFAAHGFDLFVTFSMINERALGAVLTIAYDKEDADEVTRAKQCYQAVFDSVMDAGYIPYRVGNQSMGALDPHGDVYWKTVARIKAALDPAGIIAPGRYEPGRA
jgi:4-cresol dehydrogenase (hydroxylating)